MTDHSFTFRVTAFGPQSDAPAIRRGLAAVEGVTLVELTADEKLQRKAQAPADDDPLEFRSRAQDAQRALDAIREGYEAGNLTMVEHQLTLHTAVELGEVVRPDNLGPKKG